MHRHLGAALAIAWMLVGALTGRGQSLVEMRTGRLRWAVTDLRQNAGPTPLAMCRVARQPVAKPGLLGTRWRTNWDSPDEAEGLKTIRDPQGRLARVEGPFGSSLQFVYERSGRLARVETSSGEVATYDYEDGELAAVETTRRPRVSYAYDADGALVRVEEPAAGVTEIRRDLLGRVIQVRRADGSTTGYEFDEASRTTRRTDPNGAVTAIQWSDDDRTEMITDAFGNRTVLEFDEDGQLSRSTGSTGTEVRFAYDAQGRQVSSEVVGCGVAGVEYDGASGRPRTLSPAAGTPIRLEYDATGRTTALRRGEELVAALSYTPEGLLAALDGVLPRRYTYDAAGRVAAVADSLGRVTRYEYGPHGDVVRIINPAGGETRYEYDRRQRLVKSTNPSGATNRYEYDDAGRLVRRVDAAGRATTYEYDEVGQRVAVTDADGQTTRAVRQLRPPAERVVGPDGLVQTTSYDLAGHVSERTDVFGRATTLRYDALGRLVAIQPPFGPELTYEYDIAGHLVADAAGTYTYDEAGRLSARTDRAGGVERFAYDDAGRLASVIDPLGGTTRYAYNSQDALVEQATPTGETVRFEYDTEGRLTAVGTTRLAYDALGCPIEVSRPGAGTVRYEYDQAARCIRATDAAGQSVGYAYDPLDRLSEKRLPDGSRVRYEYGPHAELLKVDDGSFPLEYAYDRGRLSAVTYSALGKTVRYETDRFGRRTRLVTSDGQSVYYAYDRQNRLASVTLPGGSTVTFGHDERNRLQAIRYPNGVSAAYRYDVADRVESLVYGAANGAALASWTYQYDAAGQPIRVERGHGPARQFRYDADGRLVQDGDREFAYGLGGNRADCRFAGDGRLVEAAGEPITQDVRGQVTRRGPTEFAYDVQGRLVQAGTVRFSYAPTSERIARDDESGRTWFLHDGAHLLEELDGAKRRVALYVYGPGTDRPVAMVRDGQTYFYHADPLGTVALLTDAQGQVAATYETDAFGVLTAQTGTLKNPFVFAGLEYEPAVRLYYVRARYYDPALGRFLSPDPLLPAVRDAGSLNPYVYARNAPTRFVDPTGLQDEPDPSVYDRARYENALKRVAEIKKLPVAEQTEALQQEYIAAREYIEGHNVDYLDDQAVKSQATKAPPSESGESAAGTPKGQANAMTLEHARSVINRAGKIGTENLTPSQVAEFDAAMEFMGERLKAGTYEPPALAEPGSRGSGGGDPIPSAPPPESAPVVPEPPPAPGGQAAPSTPGASSGEITADSPARPAAPKAPTVVPPEAPGPPSPEPVAVPRGGASPLKGVRSFGGQGFLEGIDMVAGEEASFSRLYPAAGAAVVGGAVVGASVYSAVLEGGGSQTQAMTYGAAGTAVGGAASGGVAWGLNQLVTRGFMAAGTASFIGSLAALYGAVWGGQEIYKGAKEGWAGYQDNKARAQVYQDQAKTWADLKSGGEKSSRMLAKLREQYKALDDELGKAKALGYELSETLRAGESLQRDLTARLASLRKLVKAKTAGDEPSPCETSGALLKQFQEAAKRCSQGAQEGAELISGARGDWRTYEKPLTDGCTRLRDVAQELDQAKEPVRDLEKAVKEARDAEERATELARECRKPDQESQKLALKADTLITKYEAQCEAVVRFQKSLAHQVNVIAAALPEGDDKDKALELAGRVEFVKPPGEPTPADARREFRRIWGKPYENDVDVVLEEVRQSLPLCVGAEHDLGQMKAALQDAAQSLAAAGLVLAIRLEHLEARIQASTDAQTKIAERVTALEQRLQAIVRNKASREAASKSGTLSAKGQQELQQLIAAENECRAGIDEGKKTQDELQQTNKNLLAEKGLLDVAMEPVKQAGQAGQP